MHRTISTVFVAPPAEQQLGALARPLRTLLVKRLLALRPSPSPPDATKIEGLEQLYRIREGDYRMVYAIREKNLIVLAVKSSVRRDSRA